MCWLVPYLFTDDYASLAATYQGTLKQSLEHVVAGGRSLYAGAMIVAFSSVDSFYSLRILRFISVLGIAFTAWLVSISLRRAGWSRRASLVSGFLIGTLPAFQVYASWAITFIFPWATALTALSVRCIAFRAEAALRRKAGLLALSALILVVSLNIYQPAAMFFWVFAVIQLFVRYRQQYETQVRMFGYYMLVFLSSLLASYLILKLTETFFVHRLERSQLISSFYDVLVKLKWFATYPLTDAANFVNIHSTFWTALLVLGTTLVGAFFYLDHSVKRKLVLIAMGLSIILFSYTPNLLVASSPPSYRTQVALSSLLLLFLIMSLKGLSQLIANKTFVQKWSQAGVILVLPLFSVWAIYNVTAAIVIPQFTELVNVSMQLTADKLVSAQTIYYVAPDSDNPARSLAPYKKYDEFGLASGNASWAQANAVYVVLHERFPEHKDKQVKVIHQNDPIAGNDQALVIDHSPLWKLSSFFYPK
ncbi:glucosyltransferase domain-containing protein [Paenibacillus sp. J5C_2022]|nr:glucosyltransferase domain-containing protein [Paenibacillus sp. J5C2022]